MQHLERIMCAQNQIVALGDLARFDLLLDVVDDAPTEIDYFFKRSVLVRLMWDTG